MKKYNVIDSFVFGGELEMLKMRLDYLYDSVDYFVFSESNVTHAGKPKNFVYLENKHLFEKYTDKIIYVTYTPDLSGFDLKLNIDNIYNNGFWELEKGQRDVLIGKILELSNDNTLILHGDLDEFPDKNKFDLTWEKSQNNDILSFNQKTFYYSPITELKINWYGTAALNKKTILNLRSVSILRDYVFNCTHIENGGWHFSFFETPERIKYKLENYAHQEFNRPELTNIERIKNKMYNSMDVLDRSEITFVRHNNIPNYFPIEFYRHELFYRNNFNRLELKPWVKLRRDRAMQIPLEIESLQMAVSNLKPKVIVEIGTANGGTLARWFEIPEVETIISLDFPIGIHGGSGYEERTYVISDALEQANRCGKEFYAINGDSKNDYLINRLEEILQGKKVDFLFIDGDHTYHGVKNDFLLYEKFLREDSLVGFHDIIDSEFHREYGCFVSQLWDELKLNYDYEEFSYTNLLDTVTTPELYELSNHKGGFGGIGVIKYSKEKKDLRFSLMVPIYNNVDMTIDNVKKTMESSKYINDVVLYSNGTNQEGNEKLLEFSKSNEFVNLYINENPIGFVKAVNEGFKRCKNEYIICMNSDACMYDDWEERIVPLCKVEENGLIGPVLQDDFILGCCFVVKKSVLNKIGLLNEGFGMGYHDDGELTNRVIRNNYKLGYACELKGWTPENRIVNFPINHVQGVSFLQLDYEKSKIESNWNGKKFRKLISCEHIKVLKDLEYIEIKNLLNNDDVFLVVNKSGDNFEKIRYDKDIVRVAHIFECTDEMDINTLINSITSGKTFEIVKPKKKESLTWLAKFDDYASMGILSQRVIENLRTDVSCKPIIGETETKNQLILDYIEKPTNNNLGIMFAYPDMYPVLNEYKTKVIYTGVDTTGGIPNFSQNANNVDFLLTPSNKSKDRMEKLGVTKPIFVFPHGVDPKVFKYTERIKSDIFKFLYVGECSDRKGIFQLLDAFISEFKGNSNVELHIKSNNDMKFYNGEKVTEIIKSHSNIFWHVDNQGHDFVLDLYKTCHVYVYPSRADTFGMTLLEAMACGLPVISTGEPGATELINDRYYHVLSKDVPVKDHPWMLGEWGEPSIEHLRMLMKSLHDKYDEVILPEKLKENSDYVIQNYSWEKVTEKFETEILPKLNKEYKVLTLLTSYNRPHHIKNIIQNIKDIRETGLINDVYIVENSDTSIKNEVVDLIEKEIDNGFKLYVSEFNMGQRGALLQMLEDVNIDDYDYIQFTDQDNFLNEPLSTYCDILNENYDAFFVTGYMSKEHAELAWRDTRHGKLCEKRSLRAGHMFMRKNDLKSLFPLHLDAHYGQPYNSSWNAGLDWELSWWNPKSPGKNRIDNFVLCVPGGVLHRGIDSTMYDWPVEENEYPLEELERMR